MKDGGESLGVTQKWDGLQVADGDGEVRPKGRNLPFLLAQPCLAMRKASINSTSGGRGKADFQVI